MYPGDPTTPGWASKEGVKRLELGKGGEVGNLPEIPSLPLSWKEARLLLEALDGFGVGAGEVNRTNWVGAIPGVSYSTGPAPKVTLSLVNTMEDKITWIWDAVGVINGTSEDEVVVVGSHRDAWMIGGAGESAF